jgi:hypothetical protein
MDQNKSPHVLYETEFQDWMKHFHPSIDIETYKERRDQYRSNLRAYRILENNLERGKYDDESAESAVKLEEYRRLWDQISSFEDWMLVIWKEHA